MPRFIYQLESSVSRQKVVSALILIPDWSADSAAGAREIRWAALISRVSSQYIKPLSPAEQLNKEPERD